MAISSISESDVSETQLGLRARQAPTGVALLVPAACKHPPLPSRCLAGPVALAGLVTRYSLG